MAFVEMPACSYRIFREDAAAKHLKN